MLNPTNGNDMVRMALCVGVNVYGAYPDDTLRGCVTDSQSWRKFAHNDLAIKAPIVLTDKQAREDKIKEVLLAWREEALKGDISHIFYSHSSHGSNQPDLDGDEPDKLDEVLLCYDALYKGDRWVKGSLSDDWFYDYAKSLPPWTIFELFSDACHSQTMLREMGRTYGKAKVLSFDGNFTKAPNRRILHSRLPNTVAWSGCDAAGTSADAYIDDKWQGAFTAAFMACYRDKKGEPRPRTDIIYYIREWLKGEGYRQNPHLECNQHMAFSRM